MKIIQLLILSASIGLASCNGNKNSPQISNQPSTDSAINNSSKSVQGDKINDSKSIDKSAEVQHSGVRDINVYFSPGDTLGKKVVQEINSARNQILVEGYGFTDTAICNSLIRAKKNRNVKDSVLLDKTNEGKTHSNLNKLKSAGIYTRIDDEGGIAHNKIMIIDRSVVITGSFNFTVNARRNEENLLIIDSPHLALKYIQNWDRRNSNSRHTHRNIVHKKKKKRR